MNEFLAMFTAEERSSTIEKLAQKFLVEEMLIAEGTYLSTNRKSDLQYFILDEEKCKQYEDQFLIFARATHSGSFYAFYKTPNAKNCDDWPVLVLGDEGGAVMIAKNIFELMAFWTLNTVQPYVNYPDYESFDLWPEEDVEEDNNEYQQWLMAEFGISPINSIEQAKTEIIDPAIEAFQAEINPIFAL